MFRTLRLRVRNTTIEISATQDSVLAAFEQDFAWFLYPGEAKADLRLTVFARSYLFEGGLRFGDYRWKRLADGTILASFFERATVAYRFSLGEAEVFCDDSQTAYEIAYNTLLSFVGETQDALGVHRLHGLGVVLGKAGIIFLGTSGKGKSTLAFSLLSRNAAGFLSDDIPFVSAEGTMYAFPQRIALRERPDLSPLHLRTFHREKYGEKHLVSSDYYADKIRSAARIDWLVILERTDKDVSRFVSLSRFRLVFPLLRWLVLGHETPQILPLFVRLSVADVFSKAKIVGRRLYCAFRLFLRVRAGKLLLSKNPVECAEFLEGMSFDAIDLHRDPRTLADLSEMLEQRADSPT